MKFGRYEVSTFNFGFFRLDGGAMFGSVPKNLWSQRITPDAENCIPLATRSLVLRDGKRTVLVDVGNGEKWNDKTRAIFAIDNAPRSEWPFDAESVSDVILTHLHFDHAGGISYYRDAHDSSSLALTFPNARIHLQRSNLANASKPNQRERASYLKDTVAPVASASNLNLVEGSVEVLPDVWVHQCDGHSIGQQWIEVRDGKRSIVFPTDLIPTSHHLPVPFNMGYDIHAGLVLEEKETFLAAAMANESIVVFQHDPKVAAGLVTKDAKGHYALREVVGV